MTTNDEKPIQRKLEKLDSDNLIDMVNKLIITDSLEYELCHVEIKIVYKEHLLTILLTKQIDFSMINAEEIILETCAW
jgi:hypothetical protein